VSEKRLHKDEIEVVGQTGGEWVHIGRYLLPQGKEAYVEISNAGADNVVAADAVLFLPVKK
jgi:xanthan lyase